VIATIGFIVGLAAFAWFTAWILDGHEQMNAQFTAEPTEHAETSPILSASSAPSAVDPPEGHCV